MTTPNPPPLRTANTEVVRSTVGDQARSVRFYTVTEAARLLRLSAPTLYREIRAGRFPAIRIRGRYVIPAKAVDAMEKAALAGGVVQPSDVPYGNAMY